MKVYVYEDEAWPVYYYNDDGNWNSGKPRVEVPDEVLKKVDEAFEAFREGQNLLRPYFIPAYARSN